MIFSIQLVQFSKKTQRKNLVFNIKSNNVIFILNFIIYLSNFRVERTTRYTSKVISGEIGPYVPEWQRQIEIKKQEREKILLEKEQKRNEREKILLEKEQKRNERKKRRLERRRSVLPKWLLPYNNNSVNGRPYERIFKKRDTKVDERIRQDSLKH
jgi:selenophosphate synthase